MNKQFRPVRLSYLFHFNGILPFDVFIERHQGKFTRIHKRNDLYDGDTLVHFGVKTDGKLLIEESQQQDLNNFLSDILQHSLVSPDKLSKQEIVEIMSIGMELTYQSIIDQNEHLSESLAKAKIHVTSCLRLIVDDFRSGVQLYLALAEDASLLRHSFHVMLLSLVIAKKSGFTSEKALSRIGLGALLHDIGMSRIDQELFRKPRLTPKEWEDVKDHPHLGLNMIDSTNSISHEVSSIILQHHEYCNGRGYPNRLTHSQIYPPARLVAVTDVFSSLISKSDCRPTSYTPEEAIKIMRSDIGHFDLFYIDMLEQVMGLSKKRSAA
jgi:HD-GYP domain-containing protein (c-di-GMP phosphodiesterase class II)